MAEHIAVSAARLSRLAFANYVPFLASLCEMAALEAWRAASETAEPRAEGEEGSGLRPYVNGSDAGHERTLGALRAALPAK
jgi:hypothetical protein